MKIVNVIETATGEIIRTMHVYGQEVGEKVVRSINIGLDHERYHAEIADVALDSKADKEAERSIYHVEIKPNVWVDVYDVLTAFKVTNQATGHAIKKQLKPGSRGYKSIEKDLTEAIKSLERAIEIEAQING